MIFNKIQIRAFLLDYNQSKFIVFSVNNWKSPTFICNTLRQNLRYYWNVYFAPYFSPFLIHYYRSWDFICKKPTSCKGKWLLGTVLIPFKYSCLHWEIKTYEKDILKKPEK